MVPRCCNGTEHAFAREVGALLTSLPHAHSRVWYSRPDPGDRRCRLRRSRSHDRRGHRRHRGASRGRVLPAGRVHGRSGAGLGALGMSPARVHTEAFGAEGSITRRRRTDGSAGAPARRRQGLAPVSFARSGLNVNWDGAFTGILELAEACDVPVRWSCRTGVPCGTGLSTARMACRRASNRPGRATSSCVVPGPAATSPSTSEPARAVARRGGAAVDALALLLGAAAARRAEVGQQAEVPQLVGVADRVTFDLAVLGDVEGDDADQPIGRVEHHRSGLPVHRDLPQREAAEAGHGSPHPRQQVAGDPHPARERLGRPPPCRVTSWASNSSSVEVAVPGGGEEPSGQALPSLR